MLSEKQWHKSDTNSCGSLRIPTYAKSVAYTGNVGNFSQWKASTTPSKKKLSLPHSMTRWHDFLNINCGMFAYIQI